MKRPYSHSPKSAQPAKESWLPALQALRIVQDDRDGYPSGLKRERGEDRRSDAAAAPATVSGERLFISCHWGSPWEGRTVVVTREPGDLPSAVVTCEHVGRGAPMEIRCRR